MSLAKLSVVEGMPCGLTNNQHGQVLSQVLRWLPRAYHHLYYSSSSCNLQLLHMQQPSSPLRRRQYTEPHTSSRACDAICRRRGSQLGQLIH